MLMRFVAFMASKSGAGQESLDGDKAESSAKETEDVEHNGEEKDSTEKQKSYRPHIPGQILYIYRCSMSPAQFWFIMQHKNTTSSYSKCSSAYELYYAMPCLLYLEPRPCIMCWSRILEDYLLRTT